MNRIREALRHEYIGAVAIGFLIAQMAGAVIGLIMRPVNFYVERAMMPRSVFGRADTETFGWGPLVGPVINILLLGMFAFLLLQWLYLKPVGDQESPDAQDTTDNDADGSAV
jgi:large-conductance mechanosensitive channel